LRRRRWGLSGAFRVGAFRSDDHLVGDQGVDVSVLADRSTASVALGHRRGRRGTSPRPTPSVGGGEEGCGSPTEFVGFRGRSPAGRPRDAPGPAPRSRWPLLIEARAGSGRPSPPMRGERDRGSRGEI